MKSKSNIPLSSTHFKHHKYDRASAKWPSDFLCLLLGCWDRFWWMLCRRSEMHNESELEWVWFAVAVFVFSNCQSPLPAVALWQTLEEKMSKCFVVFSVGWLYWQDSSWIGKANSKGACFGWKKWVNVLWCAGCFQNGDRMVKARQELCMIFCCRVLTFGIIEFLTTFPKCKWSEFLLVRTEDVGMQGKS